MSSKAYEKGYRFEMKCKVHFESLGYSVTRSAGSHSPIDLECVRSGERPIKLQCKLHGKLSKADRAILIQIGRETDSTVMLASSVKHGRYTDVWCEVLWRASDGTTNEKQE